MSLMLLRLRDSWTRRLAEWRGAASRADADGPEGRRVPLERDAAMIAAAQFASNRVQTARYNPVDFVPKQLVAQFSKIANVYFLLIGALQQIPGLSPTGQYTTIAPLVVFVALGMAREAYDDVLRHRQDSAENNLPATVWRDNHVRWRDLVVGDLVTVTDGQGLPADVVVLHTSLDNGACYVETSSLDGESNLKERCALKATQERFIAPHAVAGEIRAERPSASLYTFDGAVTVDGRELPLAAQQLLLRGSRLMHTREILGVVVYTGEETKVRMNATPAPTKQATMERITNWLVASMFGLLVALALLFTGLSWAWHAQYRAAMWYIGDAMSAFNPVGAFGTFLILYNTLIPISLYVTLEIVKLVQASLIGSDVQMYHAESDTPAQARTSSVNEELGQVAYVFSDKTGTLTDNIMIFRKLSVGGTAYAHVDDGEPPACEGDAAAQRAANQMLTAVALCHTIVPAHTDGTVVYQGSSPDEVALVVGAAELGFRVVGRRSDVIVIEVDGVTAEFHVLHVLEFTSDRKRMSVIVRSPEGCVVLLCKGADQVILERVRQDAGSEALLVKTRLHIDQFAREGLRTLVYAMSELSPEQYERWHAVYHDASVAIVGRQDKLDKAAEMIEADLVLLGTTAIEDRLQAGVPETIRCLTTAGIRVWVLTGDKLETAVNVGYAADLIHADSNLFVISSARESVHGQLERAFSFMAETDLRRHSVMVVDGATLHEILAAPSLRQEFLAISAHTASVVCCRVSPMQKADVVRAVRERWGAITLAIGDGANDISMIQAAHVGVGITGKEGLQAARSSDYTIAQFRFLQRLLLVHGHWSYVRVARFLLGSFYKCMALYMTQATFQGFTGFSGTSMYEQWTLASYNVLFAVLPVIFVGALEKDVDERTLLAVPQLYGIGRASQLYNYRVFWLTMAQGVLHALVCALSIFAMFGLVGARSFGHDDGMYLMGEVVYTCIVFVVTLKIGHLEAHNQTWANWIVNMGSLAVWFLFMLVYSSTPGLSFILHGVFRRLFRDCPAYLPTVLVVVVGALLLDRALQAARALVWPDDVQIVRELEKRGRVQDAAAALSAADTAASIFELGDLT